MQNLLNPKWIFLINTLPVVLMFLLFSGHFSILKSLLSESNIHLWKSFALVLGILTVLNIAYAVFLVLQKQRISTLYALITLPIYILFIYGYGYRSDEMMPLNVPQWIIPDNFPLYVGTFLMPTIAYSLFILVAGLTPETKDHKAWINFLIAISMPATGYLFTQIILPLWKPVDAGFSTHTYLILLITVTLIFLFFLVRTIYILVSKKASVLKKYQLAWKIPINVILPLLGLAVNNGDSFNKFGRGAISSGIFGNFSNYWFYILAIINGILLCLPNTDNKRYRLLLFFGRSIALAYTLYFLVVFLPFLPLSVVAILAAGTGFLMLTPLVLFIIHIQELSSDFRYVRNYFSKSLTTAILLLSFSIIPACITQTYLSDKKVLNRTLDYLYSPNYSKNYDIDKISLRKTLDVVKYHKSRNTGFLFGNQIPYLSSYFNWLVLDNLTLSDARIKHIERIFFGNTSLTQQTFETGDPDVNITDLKTKSIYDTSQNAWKSWVDLEITNKSGNTGFAEFATIINLPEGCYISDFYLFVGNRKEPGILAEKKTATWVYSNIRNENRDPGILYYLNGNKVAFRVFPFAKDEIRKTGIEFLHKEPVDLIIDSTQIKLGRTDETANGNNETDNVLYVPAKQKRLLKAVQREPYFHFLIDVSANQKKYSSDFIKRIDRAIEQNHPLARNAQVSFVNSYVQSFPLDSRWKQQYSSQRYEGGFFLERAIRTALFNSYNKKSYPVIVVVTDSIKHAIADKDFSDFRFAFPENNLFFNLRGNDSLELHSLIHNPLKKIDGSISYPFGKSVLEYKLSGNSTAYLPDNNEPSVILKKDLFATNQTEVKEKNWRSALTMQGIVLSQTLHPEASDEGWLNLIKHSFSSKVLTTATAYVVLENEVQKAVLLKKQAQVLSGKKSLDPGEDPQRMTEPGFWISIFLLGLFLWYRRKHSSQATRM